jgi:hypothetical protein
MEVARKREQIYKIIIVFGSFLLISGTPDPWDRTASNLPPVVSFTLAPQNDAIVPYRLDLAWTGSDADSGDRIHHYEVAIDPPAVFTSAEIAHPETSPGVAVSVRPGSEEGRDTVDVAKDVAGTVYSFSWIGTRDTTEAFRFDTPHAESVFVGGSLRPTNRFLGAHRVFVRGQDLHQTFSETDSVRFTAQNVWPFTHIIYPILNQEILDLGPSLWVKATGVDEDAVSPTGRPVAYLTKLLRLDTLIPPVPILQATPNLLFQGGDSTWVRHEGDSVEVTTPLGVPGEYMFGVRAVDENEGLEQFLVLNRNVFKFQAFPSGGKPELTIRESSFGQVTFRGLGVPVAVDVPANVELRFSWIATAEAYGGLIDAYSWGLDIPDVNVEGPESGWSDWGPITSPPDPIIFPNESTHVLYVRARDVTGSITLAQLILNVIAFSFDREVLVVDDSFDNIAPNDAQHDAFWGNMASYYTANSDVPPEQFFSYSVFGAGDRGNLQPRVPLLSDLAKYKLLVWENLGAGYNSDTALIRSTALSPRLSTYLRAGGKLWLDGRMTVAATTPDPNLAGADLTYPKTELGPGDWAWDFLKLHTSKVNNDKGSNSVNLLHSVWPFPGVPAVYDSMVVDLTKLSLFQQSAGGFSHADAVFDPIRAESEPDFRGDIDSLYAYGAAGTEFQGKSSQYHGKLCALRWHDPDPAPEHGRVQWFGFSLYFMKLDQAQQTFKQSLDWLREGDGLVPVSPVTFAAVRDGNGAVIRWDVAEGWRDVSFLVYREEPGRERERLQAPTFSGELHYRFVDATAPAGPVSYWLAELGRTGSISWHGPMTLEPRAIEIRPVLAPVHPNPVIGTARLAYSMAKIGHVRLSVHDVTGRQVVLLVDGIQEPGLHELAWIPSGSGGARLAAGFYLLRLQTEGSEQVRKMLVLP